MLRLAGVAVVRNALLRAKPCRGGTVQLTCFKRDLLGPTGLVGYHGTAVVLSQAPLLGCRWVQTPTANPTNSPTSSNPTQTPTANPTISPTAPTTLTSSNPTQTPTANPTISPTAPTTLDPSVSPTTGSPTAPSSNKTSRPRVGPVKATIKRVGMIKAAINKNPWAQLVKLDLSALVVVTSGGGYVLSGGSLFDLFTLTGLLVGTTMCASSAATFNQILERNFDKQMARTKKRPLVTGVISLSAGKTFGWGMGLGGVFLLTTACNPLTALLGGATILLYTHVYTPLKRMTRFNTEVGAIVGAIPPVMGWTAAMGTTGLASVETALLAGTLFCWQMHHFMTIAWNQRKDYARAGYLMQSLGDDDGKRTATKGLAWAVAMFALPPIAYVTGVSTAMFVVSGTVVNGLMVHSFWRFYKSRTDEYARKARIHGFVQLVFFMGLMVFHIHDRHEITAFVQLSWLGKTGYNFCAHKAVEGKDHLCVYLFGRKKKPDHHEEVAPNTDLHQLLSREVPKEALEGSCQSS